MQNKFRPQGHNLKIQNDYIQGKIGVAPIEENETKIWLRIPQEALVKRSCEKEERETKKDFVESRKERSYGSPTPTMFPTTPQMWEYQYRYCNSFTILNFLQLFFLIIVWMQLSDINIPHKHLLRGKIERQKSEGKTGRD
ncbi:hypothetical protein CR513_16731, partial [Mucuna pruriens]